MTPMLEELYREIEHGDEEHRKWLWDKLEDFSARYQVKSEKWVKGTLEQHRRTIPDEFKWNDGGVGF